MLSPTNVTLMEAGTQVIGSYKSVAGDGQDRVVAVTASAVRRTAWSCSWAARLPINSARPASRARSITIGGSASAPLWCCHWSTMALSLAQAALSKGGSTYLNFNTGGGVGSLGQQLLAKTINIPPTISVNQEPGWRSGSRSSSISAMRYRLEPRR